MLHAALEELLDANGYSIDVLTNPPAEQQQITHLELFLHDYSKARGSSRGRGR